MKINLVLCCDDNYVIPVLTCLTSVFENNKEYSFCVYIVTAGITHENERKFQSLLDIYSQCIIVKNIDSSRFDVLPSRGRYVVATYYRYILPEILSEDKVLYLDGDTIVTSDLGELWQTDISDYACAAVEDQRCDNVLLYNRFYLKTTYFNAGVLLVNLKYWRRYGITEQLFRYSVVNFKNLLYQDQDALNVVLSGKIKYISYTYNFQMEWYGDEFTNTAHFSKWEEINRVKNNPVIIHYTVAAKPWFKECNLPLPIKMIWREYAGMHKFIGYKETRLLNVPSRVMHILVYGVGMKLLQRFS